ncbi:MAG: hypothetical protein LKJ17_08965 [Oscillospiraceae bacterium]|jgi:preprotein translocase subunit SecG|nr:hypothetical protein [Oscillospiraceae bacterium]
MSNERLAMIFFNIGLILTLISMALGPIQITNWALTTGVVACFFAIASLCLAFLSWDEWVQQDRTAHPAQRQYTDQNESVPEIQDDEQACAQVSQPNK